jgi:N-acetylglutamate synthase-like GNAT family acetyltransferase
MDLRTRLIPPATSDFIKALSEAGLPVPVPALPNQTFLELHVGARRVGYSGFEIHGVAGLLRSVVVLPDAQGQGYGALVVKAAMEQARCDGVRELWLLTTTARAFFAHMGWVQRERADAPAQIAASTEFASICPASATCMSFQL